MSLYIMFAIIAISGLILSTFLLYGCRSKLSKPIKAKAKKMEMEYTSFNSKIKGAHLIYLDSTISYYIYFNTLNFTNWKENWYTLAIALSPLVITFMLPFVELITLYVYRNKLDDKWYKDRFGAIYAGTRYKQHKLYSIFLPVVLLRR